MNHYRLFTKDVHTDIGLNSSFATTNYTINITLLLLAQYYIKHIITEMVNFHICLCVPNNTTNTMGNSWNFKQINFEIYNLFDITPDFSVLIFGYIQAKPVPLFFGSRC